MSSTSRLLTAPSLAKSPLPPAASSSSPPDPTKHQHKSSDIPLLPLTSSPSSSPLPPPPPGPPILPTLFSLLKRPHLLPLRLSHLLASLTLTNKLVLVFLLLFLLKVLPIPYLTPPILLPHPIASLLHEAAQEHAAQVAAEPRTLEEAVEKYVKKHGRKPPKGYDAWFAYAKRNKACRVSSEGFEELYRSLRPFWGVTGEEIRGRLDLLGQAGMEGKAGALGRVRVREGGVVSWARMREEGVKRGEEAMEHSLARRAVEEMLNVLQDEGVRLPDDARLFHQPARRTSSSHALRAANGAREARKARSTCVPPLLPSHLPHNSPSSPTARPFTPSSLSPPIFHEINASPNTITPSYAVIRRSCPPSSLARLSPLHPAPGTAPHITPLFTSYFTLHPSRGSFLLSPALERRTWCDQPDLQQLHQTYIRPLSFSYVLDEEQGPWPVMSNSKIEGFGDVLVPVWYSWFGEQEYREEEDTEWGGKGNQLFWRGSNTGGRSEGLNWMGWTRSRLVSKLNRLVEWNHSDTVLLSLPSSPPSSPLSSSSSSSSSSIAPRAIPAHLPSSALNLALTDVAFRSPDNYGTPTSLTSQLTEPSFRFTPGPDGKGVPFATNYLYKAVLDLDGTAYSGRFPALMKSKSAVVRSSWYVTTWEDYGLVPWFHYVPLSVRYSEVYNLLTYFFGASSIPSSLSSLSLPPLSARDEEKVKKSEAHEEELYRIAVQGRDWGTRCARREDAAVYVYLLAIEWARVCAEESERRTGRWDLGG
ncbi:hypothetical protein JCM8547_007378 [Rhodosporidiobolus lusitaniae]